MLINYKKLDISKIKNHRKFTLNKKDKIQSKIKSYSIIENNLTIFL